MLPLVFFPRPRDAGFFPEQAFSWYFVLINIFYIAFYYINTSLLIPRLLERKKYLAYGLIIFGLIVFFGSFPRLYQLAFGDAGTMGLGQRPNRPRNFRHPILSPGSIAIFLLVFIFSTGIKVINQWLATERRSKLIENEKLHTELSFLKAQINPHFLFNTLNNIYSLAVDKSDLTAPAVMKLASIMRYVLTEAKQDSVALEKEVQFIGDYIELQKMRSTQKTQVDFSLSGEVSGKQISPLLFLPFVENAFKYGVSTREPSPIGIHLRVTPAMIELEVTNIKHQGMAGAQAVNTGIGLQNARRRLDLLYPNRHELEITEDGTIYRANLKLT